MTVLLDTHFLLWTVLGLARLDAFPWLEGYRPWGVSPVSLLAAHSAARRTPLVTLDRRLRDEHRFLVPELG